MTARATVTVTIAQMPAIQEALFAAAELAQEVEHADPALVTDAIKDAAARLISALLALR